MTLSPRAKAAASVGILAWAATLQVYGCGCGCGCEGERCRFAPAVSLCFNPLFLPPPPQWHMTHLKSTPEFRQRFPDLVDGEK